MADPLIDLYANMRRNIERTGRTILYVMDTPPFAYSIGNALKNLPELIVLGLSADDAMPLVNHWSQAMLDRGREFTDGEMVSIGGKFPCRAVHCLPFVQDSYTIQAGRYLEHEDYRVTQMLVPDPQGRFPGDPLCAPLYARIPNLGRH